MRDNTLRMKCTRQRCQLDPSSTEPMAAFRRERGIRERPVPKRCDLVVEVRADAADFGLADAGVGAQRLDQIVDLAGGDTVQVGLHDHREQRLIHPAASFQQGWEERAGAQFRDPQLQIPRRGRQDLGTGAVAVRGPLSVTLPRAGTDHRSRLRVNQFLIQLLRRQPDPVTDISGLQCFQRFQEGRLIHSHCAKCPNCEFLVRSH